MDKPEPLSDDEILDLLEEADLLTTAKFNIVTGTLRSKPTGVIREVVDRTQRLVATRYEARIAEAERSRDELVQKMHQLERERAAPRVDAQDWMLIEEDAAVDAPLDTTVLLAWQDGGEWRIESGWVGSDRGGWRHGRATHWKPLPKPPLDRTTQEKPE